MLDRYSLVPEMQKWSGILPRDTSPHSFYGRSAEAYVAENRFIYLEEARNANEELIGHRLTFCMIDPDLPEELRPREKADIERYFNEASGANLHFPSAQIGVPYSREDEPSYDNRQDLSKRCLWVDLRFLFIDNGRIEKVLDLLPKFKTASQAFTYPARLHTVELPKT